MSANTLPQYNPNFSPRGAQAPYLEEQLYKEITLPSFIPINPDSDVTLSKSEKFNDYHNDKTYKKLAEFVKLLNNELDCLQSSFLKQDRSEIVRSSAKIGDLGATHGFPQLDSACAAVLEVVTTRDLGSRQVAESIIAVTQSVVDISGGLFKIAKHSRSRRLLDREQYQQRSLPFDIGHD